MVKNKIKIQLSQNLVLALANIMLVIFFKKNCPSSVDTIFFKKKKSHVVLAKRFGRR